MNSSKEKNERRTGANPQGHSKKWTFRLKEHITSANYHYNGNGITIQ